ncbi:microtubule binding protein [Hysterangium stoloniferum]|nr:microtubule binding protein [Hysterangium stoloniferum]
MSRFVRSSKYRHVFGQPAKKEHCLDNVKLSGSAWDTNVVAVSASYVSVNWNASGGGAFAILPLPSPFHSLSIGFPARLPDVIPLARGHTATVLDTAWSPFDDNVVASAGEDGKVLIWKVDADAFEGWGAEKWVPQDFDPVARIEASPRKVGQVVFHPTASHVLASASGDHTIKLWDLGNTDAPRASLGGHGDTIQSLAFNGTGTLLVSTCRDKKLRLFDPRTGGDAVRITEGHGGIKGARVCWMGDKDNFATTGFNKMSEREVLIWELGGFTSIKKLSLDQSAGVIMPFWSDNNILFLAGKGDGNVRYYEWESDTLHSLSEHKSSEPQRGMCFLPRRALNIGECEIARAYKVHGSTIEPIGFIVPRRARVFSNAEGFQSDIFPPAQSAEPSLTAGEFFSGKTAPAKYVALDSGAVSAGPAPTKTAPAPTPAPAPAPAPVPVSIPASVRAASIPTATPAAAPPSPPAPVFESSPSHKEAARTNGSPSSDGLREENAQLNAELRDARAKIRTLEMQVETMRANAERAAKTLLG